MTILNLNQVSKQYHKTKAVLENFNLELSEGEICSVVGHSGSGKSTLLKLISGLETCTSGSIELKGDLVDSTKKFLQPEKRKIGYVFQDFALFPHLSIRENIAFGIDKKQDKNTIITELLTLLNLGSHENKYPHELSGGEQQRVALARALAPQPSIILLDEPFSSLDTSIKNRLREYVFEVIRKKGVSCIFVTHDIQDAMAVSDKIVVLDQGKIIQSGKPEEVYLRPKNAYVANFFGECNILSITDLELFGIGDLETETYGLRPNWFHFDKEKTERNASAKIIKSLFMGDYYKLTVELENRKEILVHYPILNCKPTEGLYLRIEFCDLYVF